MPACDEPADQTAPLPQRVDRQHLDVAPRREGLADQLRPPDHAHGRVLREREGQLRGGAVALDLVDGVPRLPLAVGRR